MPPALKPVLTRRHKVTGNIFPLVVLFLLGGTGAAITFGLGNAIFGWPVMVIAPVMAWFSVNAVGLWENAQLRSAMERRLRNRYAHLAVPHYFVGFAHPTYQSLLDPHEDVGFLILHDDRIEFFGGEFHIDFLKEDFREVRHLLNAHSLLGLGGWVSIEGSFQGMPVRMLIEPREDQTLLGNKNWARFISLEIRKWQAGPSSIQAQTRDTGEVRQELRSASTLIRQGSRLL